MACLWNCFRLFAWGPIFTLALVAYLSGSAVWYGWYSIEGRRYASHFLAELVLFVLEVVMLLLSYLVTIICGPGETPDSWEPSEKELIEHFGSKEGRELPFQQGKLRPRDLLQYCHRCDCFKPPRTHHCSTCNRCIPAMDHHCPWTNQCIGHKNLKAFFLFTFYVSVGSTHSAVVHLYFCVMFMVPMSSRGLQEMMSMHVVGAALAFIVALVVLASVGCLSWDIYAAAILENTTQVEDMINENVRYARGRRQMNSITFPYDRGEVENWRYIMGPNPLLWWLPLLVPGDGVWAPVREGCSEFDLSAEQVAMHAEKLAKTRTVVIETKFNGGMCHWFYCWCCLAHRFGCESMFQCPPCCDGLTVRVGDKVNIKRDDMEWYYGTLMKPGQHVGEAPAGGREGWFPKNAADEGSVEFNSVPWQAHLQGQWRAGEARYVNVMGVVAYVEGSSIPCVLRCVRGKTELLGCELKRCDKHNAYWANGEIWNRVGDEDGNRREPKKDQ